MSNDKGMVVLRLCKVVRHPCLRDELIQEARRVLGGDILMYSSYWRMVADESPDLLRRVLGHISTEMREGRSIRFPSRYAIKLLEEWV